ncbi:MAG: proline racemase family protein [Candidatus Nanopelagicales bacterium]|mgnify:CR=1 FL=1|nr:proline racemase family protein [Actinomycetota bacterium]MDA9334101.1 proline racemase family protein [Actinomycetota bacterium]HBK39246.1 proline racemase [Actinomycetota bacterium]
METSRIWHCVDSHTEGMPTRVVVGGVGVLPGTTMEERRQYMMKEADHLRTWLMYEPHGHSAMSGSIMQPPTRPDADWGVVYIEVSGCLPMCGHGTIGTATVLVETGMVEVTEPETVIRLDTPAGLVIARVHVKGARAKSVTIENVPSFVTELDAIIEVPGVGAVRYDMAYGGNFYAIVELSELGRAFGKEHAPELLELGLSIMNAINTTNPPTHPENPAIDHVNHVQLVAADSTAQFSRHAMAIYPGWFDRSPCGTGTSARVAQLVARGQLAIGEPLINESIIGTRFTGRAIGTTTVSGIPAILPEITGRAWITGTSQHMLAPDDPFPAGFLLK